MVEIPLFLLSSSKATFNLRYMLMKRVFARYMVRHEDFLLLSDCFRMGA